MGRNRTRLNLTRAELNELEHRSRTAKHPRDRERLIVVLLATSGHHTLADLARRTGRVRATIQNWLAKFEAGGLAGLLARDTSPGVVSPLGAARIQKQLATGLKVGRWHSASEIALWLNTEHGIKRSRKSLYYWLGKNGWRAPGARS